MSNNTPFLLFYLPLLVIKGVLELATEYELFVFSTLSKRAKNIVKLLSSHRKFTLNIDLDRDHHYLSFIDSCPSSYLTVYSYPNNYQLPPGGFNLNGDIVPASTQIRYMEKEKITETRISLFWEDKTSGMEALCQHLSDTFKIGSIELKNSGYDKTVLMRIATLLRAVQPFNAFQDVNSKLTFQEVMNFMPTEVLSIRYPKMKYKYFVELFKMWKAGNAARAICLSTCPRRMSIRPLALLVEDRPEVVMAGDSRSFEVKRDDGHNGLVESLIKGMVIRFRMIRG